MKTTLGVFILIILVMVSSASPVQIETENTITLERGMCYGTCPVYTLTLHGNGTIVYDGQMFVKDSGIRKDIIDADAFESLLYTFHDAGFFELNDTYSAYDITDMPSATLIVRDGKVTKRVEHYYGDTSAPKILTDLENAVDSIANVSRWITPYNSENSPEELI